jgi:DNA-binding response OmpR family regulator
MASLPPDSPVELVHWPRDDAQRGVYAREGVPCILLVAEDAELPRSIGATEDWIRLPADERDVAVRAQNLCRRLARTAAELPRVGDGAVVHGGRSAPLSDVEARALEVLLESVGAIVPRERLTAAVWPDGPPSPRSLDSLLYRLRLRIAEVNIHVLAARGRGFIVEVGSPVLARDAVDR